MTVASDTFSGTNGSPLGVTEVGNLPWLILNGTWDRYDGKGRTTTSYSSNPIAVVDVNTPNIDMSVNCMYGGDALYFRVQDASNWLRLRTYWGTSSSSTWVDTSYTEYTWTQKYSVGITHDYQDLYGLHTQTQTTTSSTAPYFPSSITHAHYLAGSYYPGDTTDHSHSKSGSPTYTSRYVSDGYWQTNYYDTYRVYLEKSVNGSVTSLWSSSISATSLRVVASLNQISVYTGGTHRTTMTVEDFKTQTKHGIGRGTTANNSGGNDFDNFSITYSAQYGWGVPL